MHASSFMNGLAVVSRPSAFERSGSLAMNKYADCRKGDGPGPMETGVPLVTDRTIRSLQQVGIRQAFPVRLADRQHSWPGIKGCQVGTWWELTPPGAGFLANNT